MTDLADRLLRWYDRHGRRDLPWQRDRDPYKVWVAEIMLQQTQVATVIPYFERFISRFPSIDALASADVDAVLHLWTGLGYYARARNLHRAARMIVAEHGGAFPDEPDEVYRLPGIGRSTAHAVLAFTRNKPLPILDGNVKRVLTRHYRVHGWPGNTATARTLWELAERNTPAHRVGDYTQAIMDLGATVCVRRRPLCPLCPVADTCQALARGEQAELPTPAPKRNKPVRQVAMIMVRDGSRVLLEQRPPSGIWGGLWSFPEVEDGVDAAPELARRFGLDLALDAPWAALRHSFTHFHLDITPVPATLTRAAHRIMENPGLVWYNPSEPDARGLAAPVKKLLENLR